MQSQFCIYLNYYRINDNSFLANQLQKSGTSIGANTREAQNAESIEDFIHKFNIAAKEAYETEYWLLLSCELIDKDLVTPLLVELKIIQKVLTKNYCYE